MIELIYSPKWFYGKDIIIDIISILVLMLIAYFSLKYYKIDKRKNYFILALSFCLIGLSFLFKIITNFTLYYHIIKSTDVGLITLTYNTMQQSNILFSTGFLLYRILMLIGLLILYIIYSNPKKANIPLILYLILISTYFSRSAYYVFHVTALMLLVMIIITYWHNYKQRNASNKYLLYSFILIGFSQIIFIFIGLNTLFYVIAEGIQLLGYIALLTTFIKVLKDGKKKRA